MFSIEIGCGLWNVSVGNKLKHFFFSFYFLWCKNKKHQNRNTTNCIQLYFILIFIVSFSFSLSLSRFVFRGNNFAVKMRFGKSCFQNIYHYDDVFILWKEKNSDLVLSFMAQLNSFGCFFPLMFVNKFFIRSIPFISKTL